MMENLKPGLGGFRKEVERIPKKIERIPSLDFRRKKGKRINGMEV